MKVHHHISFFHSFKDGNTFTAVCFSNSHEYILRDQEIRFLIAISNFISSSPVQSVTNLKREPNYRRMKSKTLQHRFFSITPLVVTFPNFLLLLLALSVTSAVCSDIVLQWQSLTDTSFPRFHTKGNNSNRIKLLQGNSLPLMCIREPDISQGALWLPGNCAFPSLKGAKHQGPNLVVWNKIVGCRQYRQLPDLVYVICSDFLDDLLTYIPDCSLPYIMGLLDMVGMSYISIN